MATSPFTPSSDHVPDNPLETPTSSPLQPNTTTAITPLPPSRRPRGRPPGSKNKPKPPVVVTRPDAAAMHAAVLEVSSGADVLSSLAAFARSRRVGLSVLGSSGAIANVVLRHPHAADTFTLHGRFSIMALSGTFHPPPLGAGPFVVTVAGPHGAVYGGVAAGALVAAWPVVVVVGSFERSEYERVAGSVEGENGGGGAEEVDGDDDEEEDVKPFAPNVVQPEVGAQQWAAGVGMRPPMQQPFHGRF